MERFAGLADWGGPDYTMTFDEFGPTKFGFEICADVRFNVIARNKGTPQVVIQIGSGIPEGYISRQDVLRGALVTMIESAHLLFRVNDIGDTTKMVRRPASIYFRSLEDRTIGAMRQQRLRYLEGQGASSYSSLPLVPTGAESTLRRGLGVRGPGNFENGVSLSQCRALK